jgi:hypothetical protein
VRDREAEIREGGANVAVIGLGDLEAARAFAKEMNVPFALLVDDRRTAYHAAGLRSGTLLDLLKPANFAARKRAKRAGFAQTHLGKAPFQLGGSFVFGPGDVDLFARAARTFGDEMPIEELVRAARAGSA